MTRRDIIGVIVLTALLIGLGGVLIWTFVRPSGNIHDPRDSIFVRQRIINLQKSAQ